MKKNPHTKINTKEMNAQFKRIDKFFRELRKDKELPSFTDFFVLRVILREAECVNLKQLYPKQHKKIIDFLDEHDRAILALRHL